MGGGERRLDTGDSCNQVSWSSENQSYVYSCKARITVRVLAKLGSALQKLEQGAGHAMTSVLGTGLTRAW